MGSTLPKVLLPAAVIAFVPFVAWRRHLSLRDDIGLAAPRPLPAVLWLVSYAAWMLGTNAVIHWRGPWDFTVWRQQSLTVTIMRVVAVGILGPISEELLTRGLLQGVLKRWMKPVFAIVIVAAVWAAMHYTYSATVIGILFVCGVMLGYARETTRSVITPSLMHILWNLFAVW